MIDRYGGGHLLIPISDQGGHSWGFFKKQLMWRNDSMQAGWIQDTLDVSERRLRRLIFPHPAWPEDFNRPQRLLVAETPWEVILLHSAGIENVVCLFECATDPVRLRTLLSFGRDFVCAFDAKGYRSAIAFRFVERLERETRQLFVMDVPSRGGLLRIATVGRARSGAGCDESGDPVSSIAGSMRSDREVHYGITVTAHFTDCDSCRFSHAGDHE